METQIAIQKKICTVRQVDRSTDRHDTTTDTCNPQLNHLSEILEKKCFKTGFEK